MRKIKFRARNVVAPACWIYGYFVIEKDCCYIINDDGKFSIIAGTENQYIGMEDVYGKEIYEEDITKIDGKENVGVIMWMKMEGCFAVCYGKNGTITHFNIGDMRIDTTNNMVKDLKIVGNLHEDFKRFNLKLTAYDW